MVAMVMPVKRRGLLREGTRREIIGNTFQKELGIISEPG